MTIQATQEEVDFLKLSQTEISTAEQALKISQDITDKELIAAYTNTVIDRLARARVTQQEFWDKFKQKYNISQPVFRAKIIYDTNEIEIDYGEVN